MMPTIDLIDAMTNNNPEGFQKAFDAIMANKLSDALEVRKVEVASQMLSPEEEETGVEDGTTEIEAEVDGENVDDSTSTDEQ